MSQDIVERLRGRHECAMNAHGYDLKLHYEAADTIESLRQQLAEVTNEKREYQLEAQGQIEFLDKKLAECQAELQSTRLQMITDFGQSSKG